MKYGMNLLLWTGAVTEEMLPTIEQLKGMGYDGVEIPMFDLDLDYATLGKHLKDMGLGSTAVTVRNLEDNPISEDPAVRAKGIELTKKTLDCCAALGADTLCGPLPFCNRTFYRSRPNGRRVEVGRRKHASRCRVRWHRGCQSWRGSLKSI